jgi:hypothetical protein
MAGVATTIRVSNGTYPTIVGKKERCAGPASALGKQVRVNTGGSTTPADFVLFTVSEASKDDSLYIDASAVSRFAALTAPAAGSITFPAPNRLSAPGVDPNDDIIEYATQGQSNKYMIIAPHGGAIEVGVDTQALTAALALNCNYWYCVGRRIGGGAYNRYHITSTDIDINSWPLLHNWNVERGKAKYAVSFHGFSQSGILIGGSAPLAVKTALQAALIPVVPGKTVALASAASGYEGNSPSNITNRCASSWGIQIEQDLSIRQTYNSQVANTVAAFLNAQP